ncbi:hypothetical protein H5410_015166 [Solanum commersonii]|uniref:Reverse transcriptase domain-containing protein n=1 Tax=Solanum commersonii TaxID=4109 RepID=A0A9J5ZSZ0_SOLCO|nr:hypothetical protein H5410_015166 [Solanum commersonii]
MSITFGNGLKTDFWNEVWIGEDSLRNSLSHLYTLSTQRNVSISQAWSQQGWDLVFRRALNDWEIGEIASLLGVLNSHPALSMRPDKPRWKLHNKGVFAVKSCYWNLNTRQSMVDIWPWKLIWKTKCPKGSLFLLVVNDHLFLHCKATLSLWNKFLALLGVKWVMPSTTKELLNSWKGIGNRGRNEHWWRTIPACIWWTLWKERNLRSFEGQKTNLQKIRMNCISLLFFWCKQNLVGDIRFNSIDQLEVDGSMVTDPKALELLPEPIQGAEAWRPELQLHKVPVIPSEEQEWLQRQFEEDEILDSIKLCVQKAPRPNGCPMMFFKSSGKCCRKISQKLLNSFIPTRFLKKIEEGGEQVGLQTSDGFIKGRQIMNAALIANECINSRMRGVEPGVVCKLDIQKAYDHLLNKSPTSRLVVFEAVVGLRVNWAKQYVPYQVPQIHELASILGYHMTCQKSRTMTT